MEMKIDISKSQWYNIFAEALTKNKWLLDLRLMQSESAYNEECFNIKQQLLLKYKIFSK